MDRNIRPIDTKREALRAMARELEGMGYTRDDDPHSIPIADAWHATRAMMRSYAIGGDEGALAEFISEPSGFTPMVMSMLDAEALEFYEKAKTRARWYGESFIPEALDMLDSASEIARDQKVDQDIDERKLA